MSNRDLAANGATRSPPGGAGAAPVARYARCLEAARRVRWDTEGDVIRGRGLDGSRAFLPAALSKVDELPFLGADARRRLSQVQGRAYAGLFGVIERAVAAVASDQALSHSGHPGDPGDPLACQALLEFAQGARKHEALFRRLSAMAAAALPAGPEAGSPFGAPADSLERDALARSRWAVLALVFDIEIFTLAHFRSSLGAEATLDPVWQDVFQLHWKEGSQHAILAEMEWRREHARLTEAERDAAIEDLIALIRLIDSLLVGQAARDAAGFVQAERDTGRLLGDDEAAAVHDLVLRAYRWQFVLSGAQEPRYAEATRSMLTAPQRQRIAAALAHLHESIAR